MSQTTEGRSVMVQGRIVWTSGDLFKGKQKTDEKTRQPLMNQDGAPKMEYGFGLAVPKSAFAQTGQGQPGEIWAVMQEQAATLYPSRQFPPQFAWKVKDGDGVDHNGQPFANREGHAGHLIFACTTTLPIKYFRHENGTNIMINEGIKCGDYVQVQVQVKAHGPIGQGKPGLYLNPLAVLFLGYGKEIVNSPSGDQIFGTQAPGLPPGASATPIAPTNAPLVSTGAPGFAPQAGAPPMPGGFQQPASMPGQFAQPAPAQQAVPGFAGPASVPQQPATQPHYGVVPPGLQPQMQQPAPQGAPAPMPGQGYPQPAYPQGAPQGGAPMPGGMPMPGNGTGLPF